MKKVVLTVAALLVSAAMVFSFAGCTDTTNNGEEESSDAVVAEVEDSSKFNMTVPLSPKYTRKEMPLSAGE